MVYHTSNDLLIEFVDCVMLRVNKSNEKVMNIVTCFGNRTSLLPKIKNHF
jgi:hypothetical protein